MTWFKVCEKNLINSNKPNRFTIDGLRILLLQTSDQNIYAIEDKCTHADRPLFAGKWDCEKGYLTCPVHEAVFAIKQSGEAIVGPAVVSLEIFPTKILSEDNSEFIYVDL